MQAVGRFGSYISGPFHPFGGAVDIIVVEQPDGSIKSSPWYVRFGKFQGVLRAKEKVINISVNGVEASFNMYLDNKGEAYFLSEVDVEEGESVSYPFSSGDETDRKPEDNRMPLTSKSCNFPADDLKKVDQIDVSNEKILRRTNSRRSRIFGLVFGRRSMKENNYKGENDGRTVERNDSLERAEYAANLMEVKWSTNLNKNKSRKDNASPFTASHMLDGKAHKDTDAVQSQVTSSMPDKWGKKSGKETCSRNDQLGDSSQSGLETYAEETTLDISCLSPPEELVETYTLDDVPEGECEVMSEVSRYVNESVMRVTEEDANVNRALSSISDPDSHLVELQACPSRHFDEEQFFNNTDVMSPGCDISQKEWETDRVKTFIYYESLESSMVRKDDTSSQTHEMLYIASGKYGEVHVCAETLHARTELISEDMVTEQLPEVIELEEQPVDGPENYSELTHSFRSCTNNYNVVSEEPTTAPKSCTQMNLVNALPNPVEKFPSQTMHNNSSDSNLGHRVQDGKTMEDENFTINSPSPSGSVDDSVMTDVENVKEEQFLFSDIDESKVMVIQTMDSKFPGNMDRETSSMCCQEGIKELNESAIEKKKSYSCSEISDQENLTSDFENSVGITRASSNSLCIPKCHSISGNEVRPLAKSLPNMRSYTDNCGTYDVHLLSRSLDSNSISSKWTLQSKDDSTSRKSNEDIEPQLALELLDIKDAPVLGELELEHEHEHANPAVGDSSKSNVASSGRWRLWSVPFRRSTSRKSMEPALSDAGNSDTDDASESKIGMQGDENILRSKVVKKTVKKVVRAISPTSEQLASLNLKEGRNTVTFTFSTSMLGKQQVDASIFLWKWNTRIVISDVDGTITKSDVLGQFMPLVGVDWSQTGVAHLFSAIKENGYQLLFLSARSISQAYRTRQFLLNLKQDGKALPDGPMVISPDGLFPSLFREVIRRTPHEFKIACLEGIKALFPSDCQPFYAGFGNRDTDEISYLKVGIPKGKIFTINPKGEVAVNRRIDTKSYKSLHALVNGMFPPTVSSEQEDFNSWNYWRLPPPTIDC
uniref:phosphatidate phosphatase PAH2-like n=1 Tax=Ziziphus jujuba TaxID=326968 RepID=A0A6P4AI66_ZIZJJ